MKIEPKPGKIVRYLSVTISAPVPTTGWGEKGAMVRKTVSQPDEGFLSLIVPPPKEKKVSMTICCTLHRPRSTFLISLCLLVLSASLLQAPLPAEASPPTYKIIDLGFLPRGAGGGFGQAVNASGQVAGSSFYDPGSDSHAFRSSGPNPPIVLSDLSDLGGFTSHGFGINQAGKVVGESDTVDFDTHAFRSTAGTGPLIDLGTLGGPTSTARGINDSSVVTGWSDTAVGRTHAFRTSGSAIAPGDDLGTLGGGADFSHGYGINAAGQVTGDSAFGSVTHAFRTTAAGAINVAADLGILPGGASSFGRAINVSGQVAGYADMSGGTFHAFRSTGNGAAILTLTDLGTLGGNSQGFGINTTGDVVGASNGKAFLYTDAFGILDLNSDIDAASQIQFPDWILNAANGINDSGLITGFATDSSSVTHAFLLEPDAIITPEPGTVALLTAGTLAGTGVLWRRRKRPSSTQVP